MRKFAVIGLGQFGREVVVTLAGLGAEVLAVDRDPDICEGLKSTDGVLPLCLDATDERALRGTGIEEVDAAVVAIGRHLEMSIVVTALLRRIAVRRILARASSELHAEILADVGATTVLNPEVEMGKRAAQSVFAPDLHTRMQLPTGHHLVEVDAREPLWGKTLGELDFRDRFALNLIALKKRIPVIDSYGDSGYKVDTNLLPTGADTIEKGDILVVIGTEVRVREFLEL